MIVKLLTEHHLEFLSLTGGFRGQSQSTLGLNGKLLEISCRGSYLYRNIKLGLHASPKESILHVFAIAEQAGMSLT